MSLNPDEQRTLAEYQQNINQFLNKYNNSIENVQNAIYNAKEQHLDSLVEFHCIQRQMNWIYDLGMYIDAQIGEMCMNWAGVIYRALQ